MCASQTTQVFTRTIMISSVGRSFHPGLCRLPVHVEKKEKEKENIYLDTEGVLHNLFLSLHPNFFLSSLFVSPSHLWRHVDHLCFRPGHYEASCSGLHLHRCLSVNNQAPFVIAPRQCCPWIDDELVCPGSTSKLTSQQVTANK